MGLAEHVRAITRAATAQPIAEGHQSRVFELMLHDGQRIVAKVLDSSLVDAHAVLARVNVVDELADLDPCVCRPLRIDDKLVNVIADEDGRSALLLCFEFADGDALDVTNAGDAQLMGQTLARLHRALARIHRRDVPAVASLQAAPVDVDEPLQLLHGDFNSGNLRRSDAGVRVFDFEDCGYGPRSLEIAQALYMVLFDFTVHATGHSYDAFADAFVTGYERADGHAVDRPVIDHAIDRRVLALQRWLDDPASAPIGIRTATPEWRQTLRAFVTSYRPRQA